MLLSLSVLAALGVPLFGLPVDVPVSLIYTHIVSETIIVFVFGSLLFANPALGVPAKIFWASFFLLLAPVATLAYWYVYIWALPPKPRRVSRVSGQELEALLA